MKIRLSKFDIKCATIAAIVVCLFSLIHGSGYVGALLYGSCAFVAYCFGRVLRKWSDRS